MPMSSSRLDESRVATSVLDPASRHARRLDLRCRQRHPDALHVRPERRLRADLVARRERTGLQFAPDRRQHHHVPPCGRRLRQGSADRRGRPRLGQVCHSLLSRWPVPALHWWRRGYRQKRPLGRRAVRRSPGLSVRGNGVRRESWPFFAGRRWIAYMSRESGQSEVFVRPFNRAGPAKRVSDVGGGGWPRWRRDGKEIVYLALDNKLMSVAVDGEGAVLKAEAPRSLFPAPLRPITRLDATRTTSTLARSDSSSTHSWRPRRRRQSLWS